MNEAAKPGIATAHAALQPVLAQPWGKPALLGGALLLTTTFVVMAMPSKSEATFESFEPAAAAFGGPRRAAVDPVGLLGINFYENRGALLVGNFQMVFPPSHDAACELVLTRDGSEGSLHKLFNPAGIAAHTGELRVDIEIEGAVVKTFPVVVRDSRIGRSPRCNLGTEPHTDFLTPRRVDWTNGTAADDMEEVYWLEAEE